MTSRRQQEGTEGSDQSAGSRRGSENAGRPRCAFCPLSAAGYQCVRRAVREFDQCPERAPLSAAVDTAPQSGSRNSHADSDAVTHDKSTMHRCLAGPRCTYVDRPTLAFVKAPQGFVNNSLILIRLRILYRV